MAPFPRICLTGPESTGKTKLAEELGRHYGVEVVPEHARDYALACGHALTFDDCEPIARGELANLDRAPERAIFDTDLISTVVYSRHYYGRCPEWIVEEARRRRADLYLLMDTDIEWHSDGVRDPGEDAREDLFDAFRAAMDEFDVRFVIVSGEWEERVARAVDAVEEKLKMEN
jgi:NadR type nicotinamide-nucleotide adenylyltransferase